MDYVALWLTVRLAAAATALLTLFGVPFAYWLATTRWRGRFVVEAAVALPLLLPPTVFGYYLLILLGPHSPLGKACLAVTGSRLPFTFAGLLVASVLCNTPFAVRPFIAAFAAVPPRLVEASWCLGASRTATFFRVTLPLARTGILTGIVMAFTHAIGEFGVVLMVGGNIPGATRTLSVAIYDQVQAMDYEAANRSALTLVAFSFAVLCWLQSRGRRAWS